MDSEWNKNEIFRRIPRVDDLIKTPEISRLVSAYSYDAVLGEVRAAADRLRDRLEVYMKKETAAETETEESAERLMKELAEAPEEIYKETARRLEKRFCPQMKHVINGTGVILHTGLGRAPIGEQIVKYASKITEGYCDLEYDLERGTRGDRCAHFENTLCELTGAEAAIAVNNNAAAVMLILTAIAKGGEVVVSRGELVEIGGKFRIPDVMGLSGAILREVGTTNRTRLSDYEEAVCGETKAFLKVHTSNYRIVGFTESVETAYLCALSRRAGRGAGDGERIPVIVDLGSGVLLDLEKYGLPHEPTVRETIEAGADVVCFSGDKLMGGPQAGIIAGKKEYIEKMKRNPLIRAFRIDKFTAALLSAALMYYRDETLAVKNIPALEMLTRPAEVIRQEAEAVAERLAETKGMKEIDITVIPCDSRAGGGALPETSLQSWAVSFCPRRMAAEELAKKLSRLETPVIGRIKEGRVVLDMRTLSEKDRERLVEMLEGRED